METGKNVVLVYHCVEERYPDGEILPREEFRRHLDFLTSEFHVVDLPEVLEPEMPERKVALTFDGGYKNFYTEILPLLREYELPATQFVVPKRIGHEQERKNSNLWVDFFDFMNEGHIKELVEGDLVTIGNKSLTHISILPALRDEPVLRREVNEGKERLEERFGITVDRYCYNSGRFDPKSVDVVREAHNYAVTTQDRFVDNTTDPLKLPRITADLVTANELRRRTSPDFVRWRRRLEWIHRLLGSWKPTSDAQIRDCFERYRER